MKVQIVSVFLIFLAAYRDRDCVEAATNSKLTIGTGDQDNAVVLALASNMTATELDVSKSAVTRHRSQTLARSHIQFHLPL
jgi:FixJ family two-component response regulator